MNNIEESKLKERTLIFLKQLEQIAEKFQSLNVKRKSVLMAANDLCEIYQYAGDVRKEIDLLLKTPSTDWEKLQDIFVELDVRLLNMKIHIGHARKPLQYLAEFCDKHIPQEEE